MGVYDDSFEKIRFDYCDVNAWIKWIEEKFLKLYENIQIVLSVRDYLISKMNNIVTEFKNDENFRKILLGGVDENGNYKENSLAKFYKDTLGIYIKTKDFISTYKQFGEEKAIESLHRIKEVKETPFVVFLNELKNIVRNILTNAGINNIPTINQNSSVVRTIIKNPEKLAEHIFNIYKYLVETSVSCSYQMFFIMNTRSSPKIALKEHAYEKLKNVNCYENIKNFLGLREEKIIEDDEYSIVMHNTGQLADLLFKYQLYIWKNVYEIGSVFNELGLNRERIRLLEHESYRKLIENSLNPVIRINGEEIFTIYSRTNYWMMLYINNNG